MKIRILFSLFAVLDCPCRCSPSINAGHWEVILITAVCNLPGGRHSDASPWRVSAFLPLVAACAGTGHTERDHVPGTVITSSRVQEKTWLEYVLFYVYVVEFQMANLTWPDKKLSFTLSWTLRVRSASGRYQRNTVQPFSPPGKPVFVVDTVGGTVSWVTIQPVLI